MSTLEPQNLLEQTNSSRSSWDILNKVAYTTTPTTFQNNTQKSIKDIVYNGTGYYIEDEVEPGLNDLQTLFLACFATLIPLIITLFTAFGIRILWAKYKRRRENSKYDGIHREGTSESITKPLHSHLLNSDKAGETHLAINTDEVEVCDGSINSGQLRSNNHSSTNGSIITMTLKNNHLIVETEERNDIEEDSRETTMKYSPNARDGVFVVEVQQGVRRSPGSGGSTLIADPEIVSDQCALVHNPPDRYSDEETLEECEDNDYYVETVSPSRDTPDSLATQVKTGLTQSTTSLTSPHQSYCYTNQQCYDNGSYGYTIYNGYINNEPSKRLPNNNKPKIMSAVYKHPHNVSMDVPLNDLLLSDLKIVPRSDDDDSIQEEQNRLGNNSNKAHIVRGSGNLISKMKSDTIEELQIKESEPDVRSGEYENKGFECNDTTKT